MTAVPTIGVEEEYLLLDPATGGPVPAAPRVLRRTEHLSWPRAELMQYQIEAATGVCAGLDEVRDQLWRMRGRLSEAAAGEGCRLVASGISPYAGPGLESVTALPRYQELARRYPAMTACAGTCACHVHVAVPSRDAAVRALARLRPWLACLLAVAANSPITAGRPAGWQSRRYAMVSRWPTGRAPGLWRDSAEYDAAVRDLIGRAEALDEGSVYFLARLSPRYPTVEVRVADICPDVDTAVLLAGLVRGLVMTALDELPEPGGSSFVDRGLVAAARGGLAGTGVDPRSGLAVPQRCLLDRLRAHVDRALRDAGDAETVDRGLALLAERGTGADRQLRYWRADPRPAGFIRALARTTLTAPDAGQGAHLAALAVQLQTLHDLGVAFGVPGELVAAQARELAAVRDALRRYGRAVPAGPGRFADAGDQRRFDHLLRQGATDRSAALDVLHQTLAGILAVVDAALPRPDAAGVREMYLDLYAATLRQSRRLLSTLDR
ncbi:carboxylate-amine ligase [Pseudosporangium ferrugineum]|uniref:Putative glutamate--cysteine ligase 2 n=1 Tax=Pseudosporangium ferrugineum TaxID=439699 RepID=A0A2T0RKA1_9ACTN|nr:YbdK family carboxylate-amine ligase [Pseudosporangium ferrugineum]PRY21603.1 carboxylate-amine ligase [Pseudosporangium ferrugineum]